jgi:hypothetical protein
VKELNPRLALSIKAKYPTPLGFQKSIWFQKPLATGFAKTMNIDKTDQFSVQNSKNEFKQNRANQNEKIDRFF